MSTRSIFQHGPGNPYHISVGALLVNAEGKILTHKRTTETTPEKYLFTLGGLKENYILMRESLEDNESLEAATLRGLKEEFGAEGKIEKYLGCIVARVVPQNGAPFEKTTLYFQVALTGEGERLMSDGESHTELVWMEPIELAAQMDFQGKHTDREDLDESKIVRAYIENK